LGNKVGLRFEGRRVLITGGAGSIGGATALRLLEEGAAVEVWDRSQPAIDALLQKAAGFVGHLSGSDVDVMDGARVSVAADQLLQRWGVVDVLVNNAGGALDKPYSLLDQTEADWKLTVDLNLMSAVRVTRCFISSMREQRYGRIVNVGSKAGRYGSFIDGPSYVAAKGALHALSLQIAMEFGPSGITCNAVCPAMVMIERVERLWKERRTLAEREAIEQSIPLRRFATPGDVAGAIAFLGSDDASFITGMALDINGGQSMHS
jgi:NAD(P)-dependent dehydrogenase (short-subunit alcohol dehydrogenase family)